MNSRSVITRKVLAGVRILRNEGLAALFVAVRRKTRLWFICFAARGIKSVTLDGCVFSLDIIPSNAVKASLLKQKYERFERHAVLQHIRSELPVVELGACIGVVSCVTNRILKDPASHVVVEVNPHVIPILESNRESNHCKFEILNRAISYDLTSVTFSPASDIRGTSLRKNVYSSFEGPSVTVLTTTLSSIVTQRGYDRFALICDIEGHEYELVQHEPHILEKVDILILETHARMIGETKHSEMMRRLAQLGFRTVEEDSFVVVMRRTVPPLTDNQGA